MAFEGFPLFAFYVPLSLSLFHPLSHSWFCAELSIHSLPLPVCVLWTPQTVLLKGRVIKRPFMQARSLWWGCHFVQCSALSLRNFRQAWPHPRRRTDRHTDRPHEWQEDCQIWWLYMLYIHFCSNFKLKLWLAKDIQALGKGCWQDLDNPIFHWFKALFRPTLALHEKMQPHLFEWSQSSRAKHSGDLTPLKTTKVQVCRVSKTDNLSPIIF